VLHSTVSRLDIHQSANIALPRCAPPLASQAHLCCCLPRPGVGLSLRHEAQRCQPCSWLAASRPCACWTRWWLLIHHPSTCVCLFSLPAVNYCIQHASAMLALPWLGCQPRLPRGASAGSARSSETSRKKRRSTAGTCTCEHRLAKRLRVQLCGSTGLSAVTSRCARTQCGCLQPPRILLIESIVLA